MTVRKATSNDVDLIVERRLDFVAHSAGPGYVTSSGFAEQTKNWVNSEMSAGRLHAWLAEREGSFAGMVLLVLWPRPPKPEDHRTTEGYIINMYVVPELQRQGIGSLLLAACIGSAEEFGIRKFVLHTTDAGNKLYFGAGFEEAEDWLQLLVAPSVG